MQKYTALAQFTLNHWWWPGAITLVTAWFWRQTVRNKNSAGELLKLLLVINNGVIGYLYFSGTLTSGLAQWSGFSLGWASVFSHGMTFLFFLTSLFWLLDLVLGRTPLTLPRHPWTAIGCISICTLGLLFPALEWVAGNHFPYAQAFGTGGVPLLMFSAGVLGGARPGRWLGRVLLILVALCSLDAGLAAGIAEKHWHYLLAVIIAMGAVIYTWFKTNSIEMPLRKMKT
jgi:hypothetical protein